MIGLLWRETGSSDAFAELPPAMLRYTKYGGRDTACQSPLHRNY